MFQNEVWADKRDKHPGFELRQSLVYPNDCVIRIAAPVLTAVFADQGFIQWKAEDVIWSEAPHLHLRSEEPRPGRRCCQA